MTPFLILLAFIPYTPWVVYCETNPLLGGNIERVKFQYSVFSKMIYCTVLHCTEILAIAIFALAIAVIEQVKYNSEAYRREREIYHINKFNTFYQGLNREI